ncbi:MAG: hypothetical protein IPL55_03655 [Saprospiraceae bacterium]|jgi:hypothetical protein|nr:hypothetical protein [Saprospiraceae bacterium]MBL0025842.1 hypothetical protein [Saprospiraceae bacterium]
MTKTQEISLVAWLDGQYDDTDASLFVKNFNPDNLRANLKLVDNMSFIKKDTEKCWSEFCQMAGLDLAEKHV